VQAWPTLFGVAAAFSGPSEAMFVQLAGEKKTGQYMQQLWQAATKAGKEGDDS